MAFHPMTARTLDAYRAWQSAANPPWSSRAPRCTPAAIAAADAKVRRLKARFEASQLADADREGAKL